MNTAYIYIGPFPENLHSDYEYLFQAHRLLSIPSSYHILHVPDATLENTHVTIEIPTDKPVTHENECKVHNVVFAVLSGYLDGLMRRRATQVAFFWRRPGEHRILLD